MLDLSVNITCTILGKKYAMRKCIFLEIIKCVHKFSHKNVLIEGFPSGSVVKNLPANAGDTGSIPGPGRAEQLSP